MLKGLGQAAKAKAAGDAAGPRGRGRRSRAAAPLDDVIDVDAASKAGGRWCELPHVTSREPPAEVTRFSSLEIGQVIPKPLRLSHACTTLFRGTFLLFFWACTQVTGTPGQYPQC